MNNRSQVYRYQRIRRLQLDLERNGYPRLQMFLLVTLTGAVGFMASYLLLRAGFEDMWLRYLMSMAMTYLAFLLLLWGWLRTRTEDYIDLPDLPLVTGRSDSASSSPSFSGKGGTFDGGGASGNYDSASSVFSGGDKSSGAVGDALDAASGADEFAVPVAAIVLLFVAIASAFTLVTSIVYTSPLLFAELLVDSVLSASLYRRLCGLDRHHWLETAIGRTVWPFLLATVMITAAGWGMSALVPEARSIGDIISHARHTNAE